jgi:Xaa-Pro aminopeptidase
MKRGVVRRSGLFVVVSAVLATAAPAQRPAVVPTEELAARRAELAARIPDGFAVVLGALSVADYGNFRQNNPFFYLTGVETPNAILVVDGESKKSSLFVPRLGTEKKEGEAASQADRLKEASGIETVADLDRFLFTLAMLNRGDGKVLYVSQRPEEVQGPDAAAGNYLEQQRPWDNRLHRSSTFAGWYRERWPAATIKSWDEILDAQRWIKSPSEIEALRQAGRITALGMNEAIRATRPGRFEYQVAAAADFVYRSEGSQRNAFAHIAASGADANEWHYMENDKALAAGDLILLDTGAEYDYYAADGTRTWPVSGTFTEEQAKMYECVREASEKIIAAIKPGVTIADLQRIAEQVYDAHGFGDIGPPRRKEGRTYVGHFVGLAVHDVGSRTEPWKPGVVFNVEPILEKPGIHIRLEDTILVTESGHENFTAASPTAIPELEKLYAEGSRLFP